MTEESARSKRRLHREPFLHFLLIGLGLCAAEMLFGSRPGAATGAGSSSAARLTTQIDVSQSFIDSVRARVRQETGHDASQQEIDEAVTAFVDEEVLYREACRLGLDRGDTIVRRRLIQKM